MSQKVRLLSAKVDGAVYLGVVDGQDAWSSDPDTVLEWMTSAWRTRFNQHRSTRSRYAHGFHDQVGADEFGRVLVPLGSRRVDVTDAQARALFPHLAALPAMVLQSAERIEAQEWFAAVKRRQTRAAQGRKPGRMPQFQSRKRDDARFVCWFNGGSNAVYTRTGRRSGMVTIRGKNPSGKHGPAGSRWQLKLRVRHTQPVLDYTSVHVNLTRRQVVFTSPPAARPHRVTGEVVGVDVGAVRTATTSNGDHFTVPDQTARHQEVARLDRKLAKARIVAEREGRDWRRSKRYQATRKQKQAVEAQIARTRDDWAHKTANHLVDYADVLVFEGLDLQAMTRKGKGCRKTGMNRAMARAAIGRVRDLVAYKAAGAGVDIVTVRAAYTSQRCNKCGHTSPENRKSQAVFSCTSCRHTCNADLNAARNIRDLAVGAWTNASSAGSQNKTDKPTRASRKRPASALNRKPPATRPTRAR